MAYADYRLCDVCGEKTFYDAKLSYQEPDSEHREWWLHGLGDWGVICADCAQGHEIVIRAKPDAARIARNCNNWRDGRCGSCGAQWQQNEVSADFACPYFRRRGT